nr:hypothetical protein [Olsenella porci]
MIDLRFEQFAKASHPIVVTLLGIVMLESAVQFLKVSLGMTDALLGNVTVVRALQPENSAFPSDVSEPWKETVLKEVQFQNAAPPTLTTLLGIVMLVSRDSWNASFPIDVTELGMLMVVICIPENA